MTTTLSKTEKPDLTQVDVRILPSICDGITEVSVLEDALLSMMPGIEKGRLEPILYRITAIRTEARIKEHGLVTKEEALRDAGLKVVYANKIRVLQPVKIIQDLPKLGFTRGDTVLLDVGECDALGRESAKRLVRRTPDDDLVCIPRVALEPQTDQYIKPGQE